MYIQYIYSARTPLYYLLLIVFVKGLHLFLISLYLIYLAHGGLTIAMETRMDQLDWNVPGLPFHGKQKSGGEKLGVHQELPLI